MLKQDFNELPKFKNDNTSIWIISESKKDLKKKAEINTFKTKLTLKGNTNDFNLI